MDKTTKPGDTKPKRKRTARKTTKRSKTKPRKYKGKRQAKKAPMMIPPKPAKVAGDQMFICPRHPFEAKPWGRTGRVRCCKCGLILFKHQCTKRLRTAGENGVKDNTDNEKREELNHALS